MLPRTLRLHQEKDIRRTLRDGSLYRGIGIIVRVYSRGDKDPSRFAVVVGKKVHGSAVKRHRYQRLLREAARKLLEVRPVGYDMVVVALHSFASTKNVDDATGALNPILKRLDNTP